MLYHSIAKGQVPRYLAIDDWLDTEEQKEEFFRLLDRFFDRFFPSEQNFVSAWTESQCQSSRREWREEMDSAGAMIAFHLSVPYGPGIVSEQDVYDALKHGSLAGIKSPAKDILSSLFSENSPTSILKAAYECGSSVENVQKLYEEIIGMPFPPSPEWEKMTL